MDIRSPYPTRGGLAAATVTAVAALALTGCQVSDPGRASSPSAGGTSPSVVDNTQSVAAGQPTQSRSSGPASTTSPLPDVCTLLSRAEVKVLTGGKPILSVDPDGAGADATVRYCQWQLSGARLAVQLSPTTEATFRQDHPGLIPVTGLGDEAHFFSNHLFVRKESVQIDVYASTAEGLAADQRLAKMAAAMIVTRL